MAFDPINSQTPRAVFIGVGTRGPFAFQDTLGNPIRVRVQTHVTVRRYATVTDEDGTLLTLNTDYTIDNTDVDAVTITLTTSQAVLTSTERLEASRLQDIDDVIALSQGGDFSGPALADGIRILAERQQELRRDVDRSLKTSWRSTATPRLPIAPSSGVVPVGHNSGDELVHIGLADFGDATPAQADWLDIVSNDPGENWRASLMSPMGNGWPAALADDIDSSHSHLPIREKLSGSRNYYVRTDGSDSNTGLADTAGGAFLTLQKAIDTVAETIDLNGNDVTINVAAGTYTGGVIVDGPWVGPGTVSLVGASITTAIISTTGADAIKVTNGGRLFAYGLKVQTTTSGCGVKADLGGNLNLNAMNYGVCAESQIEAGTKGYVQLSDDYSISGGAVSHMHAGGEGANITAAAVTALWLGSVTYSSYGLGTNRGSIDINGLVVDTVTHSATVTGKRFVCHYNGTIVCAEEARNYFPGNSEGTVDNGGVYISNQGEVYDSQQEWEDYTPTITAGTGTFTTVSCAARYKIDGTTCRVIGEITVTTVGTAEGTIVVPLPNLVEPIGATPAIGFNKDTGVEMQGYAPAGGGSIFFYPTVFPANGEHVPFEIIYECAEISP